MKILANQVDFVRATSFSWHEHLKAAIRDVTVLREILGLSPANSDDFAVESRFGTFVPLPFLYRMEPGNPNDPLLRQVLPVVDELNEVAGFTSDPNQETDARLGSGILQKYPGRALLVAAKTCAVNCRYCFRREFPYQETPRSREAWQASLDLIRKDASIQEVILSGGDPLIQVDESLGWLLGQLDEISHLRRLRIHTRMPVVIPQRVTPEFVSLLGQLRLPVTFVLHINHAQEIDASLTGAMKSLREVPRLVLLNQSVLLRGVNDQVEALQDLSWRLLEAGAIPYYLHQLDRVSGSAHFEVPIEQGRRLVEGLRSSLPGYAVPRFCQERPGELSKTILV